MIARLGKSITRCTKLNNPRLSSTLKINKNALLNNKNAYYFAQDFK